ncbi:lamin tail domain-containing protein [Myxococcaceae bacterium GXIMD 01537]
MSPRTWSLTRLLGLSALLMGLAVGCDGSSSETSPPIPTPRPDAERSTVEVSRAKDVLADGQDSAVVTVTVRRAAGEPAANQQVQLEVSGEGAKLTPSIGYTDASGVLKASLTAKQPGAKKVKATVFAPGGAVALRTQPVVEFKEAQQSGPSLAFSVVPESATAGAPLGVEVIIRNAQGQTDTGATQAVTLSLGAHPEGAELKGTLTTNAVNGVARFNEARLERAGTGYTLVASATGLANATSSAFDVVPGTVAALSLETSSPSVAAGGAVDLSVTVGDAMGNVATNYTGTVVLTSSDATAVLPAAEYTFLAADAGRHTFQGIVLKHAGTVHLTVTEKELGQLLQVTADVNVVPGPAAKLAFSQQPANQSVRAALSEVRVALLDAFDNATPATEPAVTLALQGGAGTLSGTATQAPVNGVASFAGLSVDAEGSGYTLKATAQGLTEATSAAFNIADDAAPAKPVLAATSVTRNAMTIEWDAVGDDGNVGTASAYALRYSTSPINTVAEFDAATLVVTGAPKAPGSRESASLTGLTASTTYYVKLKVTDGGGNATYSDTLSTATKSWDVTKLAFTQQPANGTAGAALADVRVALQDVDGNTVTSSSAAVTLRLSSDPAFTATVSASNGVATFSGLVINRAGTGRTFDASSGALTTVTSQSFDIAPAAAAKLAFVSQPQNGKVRAALPAVTVALLDAFDNETSASLPAVTLALQGAGTLSGTATQSPASGMASFAGLSVDAEGTGYTLKATAQGLQEATSAAFNIVDDVAPAKPVLAASSVASKSMTIEWDAVGDDGNVGTASSYALRYSTSPINTVAEFDAATAVSTGAPQAPGTRENAALSGLTAATTYHVKLKVTDSAGNATYSDTLSISTKDPVVVKLAFTQQPANGTAGVALAAIRVALQDDDGNTVTQAISAVTLRLSTDPAVTATVNAVSGVATFSGLVINRAGTGRTFDATSGALATVTSQAFNIAPAAAAKLAFVDQPQNGSVRASLATVTVALRDAFDNDTTASSPDVTLALQGAGTLSGTATRTPANGVASFAGLSVDAEGTNFTLKATAQGLTEATSAAFNIVDDVTPANPVLAISAVTRDSMTIEWDAVGDDGNLGTASMYTMRFSTSPINTEAEFENAQGLSTNAPQAPGTREHVTLQNLDPATTYYVKLKVYDGAGNAAYSNTISDTTQDASVTQMAFTQQPANGTAGVALSDIRVALLDVNGDIVTSATSAVTLKLRENAAITATVHAVDGVATFSGLRVDVAGSGYAFQATSGSLATVTSQAFDISAAAASKLAFVSQPQNGTVRTALGAVTVAVRDAFDNDIAASSPDVTLSLQGGAGALSGAATQSPVNGVASFSGLSVDQEGVGYRLKATAQGLTEATSAAFNIVDNVAPGAVSLSVSVTTFTTVALAWTATGDDGNLGMATSYDLRYSTSPITTDAEFNAASSGSIAMGTPQAPGSAETATVMSLNSVTTYYFALKVGDGAGNWSAMASTSGTTQNPCDGFTCEPSTLPATCAADGVSVVTFASACVVQNNVATCVDQATPTACTGVNAACYAGECGTAAPPAAGEVFISEVMHSPSVGTTEYIELTNATQKLLNLNGLTVTFAEGASTNSFTVDVGAGNALVVGKKGTLVLAQVRDAGVNGGVTANYGYGSAFNLSNTGQLTVKSGATTLETLAYDINFPQTPGRAMNVSSAVVGTSANQHPWYWCDATTHLGGGDWGSPNTPNADCGMTVSPPVDYCRIQFPKTIPSMSIGATVAVFSQFWEPSVTDRRKGGNDLYPYLVAELGYGTSASNPASWTWKAASYNASYSNGLSDDDEVQANLTIGTAGNYFYGYRFRLVDPITGTASADTYCDQNGVAADFATAVWGTATVTVPRIVISEFSGRGAGTATTVQTDEFIELYNPGNQPVDLSGWRVQYKSAAATSFSATTGVTIPDGKIIPAHGYLLLAHTNYSGGATVPADVTYSFDTSASTSGGGGLRLGLPGIGLTINDPLAVDSLSYGNGTSLEGAAAPSHPAAGGSLERKARASSTSATMAVGGADEFVGNSQDTNVNSADFVTRAVRQPQNSSSPTETP